MSETADPLNKPTVFDDEIIIMHRPHDEYTEIGECIVAKWEKYLRQKRAIGGSLGYSDELEMIIAEELRIKYGSERMKT